MKKIILLFTLLLSQVSFGQETLAGRFVIEPTIGITNAGRTYLGFVKVLDGFASDIDGEFEIRGPIVQFGARAEYLFSDNLGFALEGNYEKSGYDQTFQHYSSITGNFEDTTVMWRNTKTRFMGRFMFHFGNSENVDWYTGAGLGYTLSKETNPENRLDESHYNFAFLPKLIDRISDPFAARIFIGARFMFNDHLGLLTEVGLGAGSLLQIGLSARF